MQTNAAWLTSPVPPIWKIWKLQMLLFKCSNVQMFNNPVPPIRKIRKSWKLQMLLFKCSIILFHQSGKSGNCKCFDLDSFPSNAVPSAISRDTCKILSTLCENSESNVYTDWGPVREEIVAIQCWFGGLWYKAPWGKQQTGEPQPIAPPPRYKTTPQGTDEILDLEKISRGNYPFFSLSSWRIEFPFLDLSKKFTFSSQNSRF